MRIRVPILESRYCALVGPLIPAEHQRACVGLCNGAEENCTGKGAIAAEEEPADGGQRRSEHGEGPIPAVDHRRSESDGCYG